MLLMTKKFLFILTFLLCFTPTLSADDTPSVSVDFQFPFDDQQSIFGINIYKNHIAGAGSVIGPEQDFLEASIVLKNLEDVSLTKVQVRLKVPGYLYLSEKSKGEWGSDRKGEIEKQLGQFPAGGQKTVSILFKKPKLKKGLSDSFHLEVLVGQGESQKQIDFSFPFEIKSPSFALGALGLLGICLIFGGLLFLLAKRFQIFHRLTTTEIVSLAVFSAFYVVGSFILMMLRAFGIPTFFLQIFWGAYFFVIIILSVRFIPKVGTVAIVKIAGTLIGSVMFYGISPVMLLTHTIPAVLALELWFLLTGYGKSMRSCVGAGLVYLLVPSAFFWFYVSPLFYHHYYALWYAGFWLSINAVSFVLGGFLGYRVANRVVEVVK